MLTKQKKTAKSLIVILVIVYLLFAIFAAGFVLFGVGDGGIVETFKFHFADLAGFFTFKPVGLDGALKFVMPGLFYAFAFLAVLYLIVGIAVGSKKHRAIPAASLIAIFLGLFVYFLTATGLSKYLAVIQKASPYESAAVLLTVYAIVILASAALFIVFSYVAYFMSLVEAIKNPRVEEKPAEHPAPEEAPKAEENQPAPAPEIAYTEEPVMFEPIEEPAMEFEPLPEPEPAPEEAPLKDEQVFAEEPKQEAPAPKSDNDDLKSLLREVVRDIVRDEIARNNANQPKSDFNPLAGGTITGATFGGPLVVQYFNGGINSPAAPQPAPQPEPAPATQPAPAPQPVKEEPKEEPQPEPQPEPEPEPQPEPAPAPIVEEVPEEQPVEEPQPEPIIEEQPIEQPIEEPIEEPAPEPVQEEFPLEEPQPEPVVEEEQPAPIEEQPVEEAQPEPAPVVEKKPIIRIPFTERMINADEEMKNNYNELKNEILSYGVNSRVSNSGDTFRLHRVTYVKITIAGLSLKLYFALNPDDYKDSTLPIQNAGHKGIYAEIPLVFKVKSGLSMRRCKQLIQDVMDKNGLEQGEIKNIDWVEELKSEPQNESED